MVIYAPFKIISLISRQSVLEWFRKLKCPRKNTELNMANTIIWLMAYWLIDFHEETLLYEKNVFCSFSFDSQWYLIKISTVLCILLPTNFKSSCLQRLQKHICYYILVVEIHAIIFFPGIYYLIESPHEETFLNQKNGFVHFYLFYLQIVK